MKNKVSTIVRIVVSFGLLGLLFWLMRDELKEVARTIVTCRVDFMVAAIFFLVMMVVTLSLRLKIVFNGEDLDLPFGEATQLTCVGYFFNNFMPTAVGGDIVKAHYAAHFNKKKVKSYASVLMDRLIGLLTILIIAGTALTFDRGRFQVPAIRPLVGLLLALGIGGFVVATHRSVARFLSGMFDRLKMFRLGEKLNEIYSIVHDYRNRRDVVLKSMFMSLAAQSVFYIMVFLFFAALGKPVSLGNIFLVMPVVIFISMLPSIGGLGVREYAIVTFFSGLAGKEVAFAVSLLVLSGYFLISIAGGVIYMFWGFKPSAKEEEEDHVKVISDVRP